MSKPDKPTGYYVLSCETEWGGRDLPPDLVRTVVSRSAGGFDDAEVLGAGLASLVLAVEMTRRCWASIGDLTEVAAMFAIQLTGFDFLEGGRQHYESAEQMRSEGHEAEVLAAKALLKAAQDYLKAKQEASA